MRIRTVDISDEVAKVLGAGSWEGTLYRLPPGQLDRKLYVAVDKVLIALGGKWSRSSRGHEFAADAQAELMAALESGGVVDRKRTLELFETPVEIASGMALRAIALLGDRRTGLRVLEPSAGRGRLIAAFAEQQSIDLGEIVAFDIDAANCDTLKTQGIADTIVCGDFLGMKPCPAHMADVILMNPPFGRCADIAHVRHAFETWLAPGGVLVAVMSPHWTFANDQASADFSAMLRALPWHDWAPLPEGSFRSEGTGVNVGILCLRKPV